MPWITPILLLLKCQCYRPRHGMQQAEYLISYYGHVHVTICIVTIGHPQFSVRWNLINKSKLQDIILTHNNLLMQRPDHDVFIHVCYHKPRLIWRCITTIRPPQYWVHWRHIEIFLQFPYEIITVPNVIAHWSLYNPRYPAAMYS